MTEPSYYSGSNENISRTTDTRNIAHSPDSREIRLCETRTMGQIQYLPNSSPSFDYYHDHPSAKFDRPPGSVLGKMGAEGKPNPDRVLDTYSTHKVRPMSSSTYNEHQDMPREQARPSMIALPTKASVQRLDTSPRISPSVARLSSSTVEEEIGERTKADKRRLSQGGEEDFEDNLDVIVEKFGRYIEENNTQAISVKQLRHYIPMLIMGTFECRPEPMLKKVKGMWSIPPEGWPEDVPFCDPNNGQKIQGKPRKGVLIKMFQFLIKIYLDIYGRNTNLADSKTHVSNQNMLQSPHRNIHTSQSADNVPDLDNSASAFTDSRRLKHPLYPPTKAHYNVNIAAQDSQVAEGSGSPSAKRQCLERSRTNHLSYLPISNNQLGVLKALLNEPRTIVAENADFSRGLAKRSESLPDHMDHGYNHSSALVSRALSKEPGWEHHAKRYETSRCDHTRGVLTVDAHQNARPNTSSHHPDQGPASVLSSSDVSNRNHCYPVTDRHRNLQRESFSADASTLKALLNVDRPTQNKEQTSTSKQLNALGELGSIISSRIRESMVAHEAVTKESAVSPKNDKTFFTRKRRLLESLSSSDEDMPGLQPAIKDGAEPGPDATRYPTDPVNCGIELTSRSPHKLSEISDCSSAAGYSTGSVNCGTESPPSESPHKHNTSPVICFAQSTNDVISSSHSQGTCSVTQQPTSFKVPNFTAANAPNRTDAYREVVTSSDREYKVCEVLSPAVSVPSVDVAKSSDVDLNNKLPSQQKQKHGRIMYPPVSSLSDYCLFKRSYPAYRVQNDHELQKTSEHRIVTQMLSRIRSKMDDQVMGRLLTQRDSIVLDSAFGLITRPDIIKKAGAQWLNTAHAFEGTLDTILLLGQMPKEHITLWQSYTVACLLKGSDNIFMKYDVLIQG